MKIAAGALLGIAVLGCVSLVGTAARADGLPFGGPRYAQPFTWTGFYIGGNGGYAWSPNNDQLRDVTNGPGNQFFGLSPEGGFGGGQIGYNWQIFGPLVIGVEADIQGSAITDSFKWTLARQESDVDWFGTVRGRLGFAADRALFYATGGYAYGHVRNAELGIGNGGSVNYIADNTASGYAVGGGIEYKFSPAWSIKTEYQYFNLGLNDPVVVACTFPCALGKSLSSFGPGVTVRDDEFHTIRVGLNYHFGVDDIYAPLK